MTLILMHIFIFLIITIVFNQVNCQQLTAVKSKSNLRFSRYFASSVYDGDEKITSLVVIMNKQCYLTFLLTLCGGAIKG
jgi:hypothetical protein